MKHASLRLLRSLLALALALCMTLTAALPGLAAEAETEPATAPVTEPATEPATEPVTDPTTEPETEPETEPATEPETQPDVRETLLAAVNAAVEALDLTRPEGEVSFHMQDNYVAGKKSSYVAIGDAAAYGDSYVPLLAEELGVSFVNLTAANMQTPLQTQTLIWTNRDTIAAADILTLGCQSTAALSGPELELPDMDTPDWDLPEWDLPEWDLPEWDLPEFDWNLPDIDLPDWNLPDFDWNLPDKDLGNSGNVGGIGSQLPKPSDTELVTAALQAYVRSCGNYAAKLPQMVKSIRSINDDAVLLVVGMYDPLEGLSVTVDGETVALDGLLDGLVEAVNLHAADYCQTSKSAVYVNAPDVQTVREAAGEETPVEARQLLRLLFLEGDSLLPSPEGHDYLRERILSGLIRVYRLAGDTRFHTAIKAADVMKANLNVESFDNIILASGSGFADALSGCYLASVKNAPILLSYTTQWNQLAADYIKDNLSKNGTVYILGGTAAVPEELETMLEGLQVVRLAGENRFETNLRVLQEAGISGSELLVCTGSGFADSLSASAVGLPILLVNEELYADQEAFLAGLTEPVFTVIGGEAAVTPAIAESLIAYGSVERLAGENRIETSIAIAERYFDAPESMVLAGAGSYPDGLCGGVLAGSMGAPLLLTMAGYGKTIAAYAEPRDIDSGIVLGGRGSVTDAVVKFAYGLGTATNIPIK